MKETFIFYFFFAYGIKDKYGLAVLQPVTRNDGIPCTQVFLLLYVLGYVLIPQTLVSFKDMLHTIEYPYFITCLIFIIINSIIIITNYGYRQKREMW